MKIKKIIKLPEVIETTGLSRSSVYEFVKRGNFPRQIQLGERSVGWVAEEVEQWINDRIAKRG